MEYSPQKGFLKFVHCHEIEERSFINLRLNKELCKEGLSLKRRSSYKDELHNHISNEDDFHLGKLAIKDC